MASRCRPHVQVMEMSDEVEPEADTQRFVKVTSSAGEVLVRDDEGDREEMVAEAEGLLEAATESTESVSESAPTGGVH